MTSAAPAAVMTASSGSPSLDCQRRGISSSATNNNCCNNYYILDSSSSSRTKLQLYRPSTLQTGSSLLLTSATSTTHPSSSTYRRQPYVTSTKHLQNAASEQSAATEKEEGDDDECPAWQNPLHHNNPEYTRVLSEEFEEGEEMPVTPLPPFDNEDGSDEEKVSAPPHLHELADEIVRLNMLEVKELVDRIGDHFGFTDDDDYMDDGGEGGGGGAAAAEEVVEKTAFDLKLTGFDAKVSKTKKQTGRKISLGKKSY